LAFLAIDGFGRAKVHLCERTRWRHRGLLKGQWAVRRVSAHCGISSSFPERDARSILLRTAISAFLASEAGTEAMSEADPDEKIDATFRNGSLTATGIILGFSLNFISLWVSNPNDWSRIDLLPMSFLTVGIAIQVKVFADLLARDSLVAVKYDRARRLFLIGLSIVATGMGIALMNDILGLGSMRMLG
jgi:hypothetical protein